MKLLLFITRGQVQPNILNSLTLDQALRLAKKESGQGWPEKAEPIYQNTLMRFFRNKIALSRLKDPARAPGTKKSKTQWPPLDLVQLIINLYNLQQMQQALQQATILLQ